MTFWDLAMALLTVVSMLWAARRLRRIAWRVHPSDECPTGVDGAALAACRPKDVS
jgi:hypothetical protein